MKRCQRFLATALVCGGLAGHVFSQGTQPNVLDLAGIWSVRQADGAKPAIPLQVPGDVHSALLAAGLIPDPYFGKNEEEIQWVGRTDWVAERVFDVTDALLSKRAVCLRLEHVDTFCEISINGKKVGDTGNRFRRYDFDVKPFLKQGRNTITALFRSAELISEEKAKTIPFALPMVDNGKVPHINLLRKPACHGGWDWGIAMMMIGFAGKTELIGTDLARLDYVTCDQAHQAGRCDVTVTAEVMSPAGGEAVLAVTLGEAKASVPVRLTAGNNRLSAKVTVENPRLWWPNGAGEQALYDLSVSVGEASLKRRLGLRTIEVVNKADAGDTSSRPGMSMTFRVNGIDLFCKGANWIPCDGMTQRQTPERYRDLLVSAKSGPNCRIRSAACAITPASRCGSVTTSASAQSRGLSRAKRTATSIW